MLGVKGCTGNILAGCRMRAQQRQMNLKLPLPQLCWPVCLDVSVKEESYPCWMKVKTDFSRAFDLYRPEPSWAVSECAGKMRLICRSSSSEEDLQNTHFQKRGKKDALGNQEELHPWKNH